MRTRWLVSSVVFVACGGRLGLEIPDDVDATAPIATQIDAGRDATTATKDSGGPSPARDAGADIGNKPEAGPPIPICIGDVGHTRCESTGATCVTATDICRCETCGEALASCASQGLSCGVASDGFGAVIDCGNCTPPQACVANHCVGFDAGCTPKTCAERSNGCGIVDDGCGNQLDCGPCGYWNCWTHDDSCPNGPPTEGAPCSQGSTCPFPDAKRPCCWVLYTCESGHWHGQPQFECQ